MKASRSVWSSRSLDSRPTENYVRSRWAVGGMCVHRPLRARTGIQTYRAECLAGSPVSGLSVCRFALADAGARGGGIVHDPAGHHCRNTTRFRVLPLLPQPVVDGGAIFPRSGKVIFPT